MRYLPIVMLCTTVLCCAGCGTALRDGFSDGVESGVSAAISGLIEAVLQAAIGQS